MKTINFVVPCYNEQGNITDFYDAVTQELNHEKYKFTYTFINDGSKDNTINELKEVAQKDKKVKIINFSRNYGKEAAILAGLDFSTDYDATIIIDADLEMPIRYANEMIEHWENGKKLVVSYRDNRRKGFKNWLASKFYNVYNKMSDSEILKDALDFQLMDKEIVNEIVRFREYNRFFKGITGLIGYDREVIGVSMVERQHGKSSFGSFSRLFSYAIKGITVHSTVLLSLSGVVGLVMAGTGMIYMVSIIISKFISGNAVSGWSSLMSVILIFFGVTLVILGIIGYYVGLIYGEVKQRPNYLISEKVNIDG